MKSRCVNVTAVDSVCDSIGFYCEMVTRDGVEPSHFVSHETTPKHKSLFIIFDYFGALGLRIQIHSNAFARNRREVPVAKTLRLRLVVYSIFQWRIYVSSEESDNQRLSDFRAFARPTLQGGSGWDSAHEEAGGPIDQAWSMEASRMGESFPGGGQNSIDEFNTGDTIFTSTASSLRPWSENCVHSRQ